MPFTKAGSNKFKSPSGRKFTKKQVKLYYASEGFSKLKKTSGRGRGKKKKK